MATIKIPSGATLNGLAQQYKTTVNELMKLNPSITNPNLIYAGASLNIPTAQQPVQPVAQPTGTVTAPLGSAERTAQLTAETQRLLTPVSPEVTPAAPTPAPTLPTPTATPTLDAYYTSMASQVNTARKTLEDTYNKQIADLQAKQTAAQKKIDEFTTKQETIVGAGGKVEELTAPFRADLEKTERERLKVEENFFANQTLTNELDSLLTEGNTLVQQMKGVTGLAGIRGPRVNKTISDISARVGVIQAVMNVRNGQITQAYNLIDRSVSAMTADRNDRLSYYKTLFNFYKEQKDTGALISLKADEKKILSAQINLIQNDLVQAQNNADYIKNLMINPESASFMASAGVTLNDTPAQVNAKLATETTRRERDDFKNKKIADGYEYVPFPTAGQDTVQFTVGGQTLNFKRPPKKWSEPYQLGGDWVQKNKETGEIRTAVNVPKETSATNEVERIAQVDRFLQGQAGQDGFISAESYIQARQKWNTLGGTDSDFKLYYPIEQLMREEERNRLFNLYPSLFKSTGAITNEKLAD